MEEILNDALGIAEDKVLIKHNKKIKSYMYKMRVLLNTLPIDTLFLSLTSVNGLFYRFANNEKCIEFKWQVFFEYDKEDPEEVECTLHIYKNNLQISSNFGSVDQMFTLISKSLL